MVSAGFSRGGARRRAQPPLRPSLRLRRGSLPCHGRTPTQPRRPGSLGSPGRPAHLGYLSHLGRVALAVVTVELAAFLATACATGDATVASGGATTTARDCREPGTHCSLAEVARQTGIAVGTALGSDMPPGQLADTVAHFNAITTENAFKWGEMSPSPEGTDFSVTDRMVAWARDNHLRIRAHTLFWHRNQVPGWVLPQVDGAADPAAELRAVMRTRIREVVGRYAGKIEVWDVVNEPLAQLDAGYDTADTPVSPRNFFYTTLGEQYIDDAFRWAREADPDAKLFLNEIVWNPAVGDPKADALLALVERLKHRGVPIDGVGIQAHGMLGLAPPWFPASQASLAGYLRALGDLGVDVEITELDVALPLLEPSADTAATRPADLPDDPLEAQAAVYQRVAGACGEVPACTGLTVWGLRDPDSWLDTEVLTRGRAPNRPLLLDADGNRKPAYAAVARGLLERCTTPGCPPATPLQPTPSSAPS